VPDSRSTYSWATKKAIANTWQRLVLQLTDHRQHRVNAKLTK
jgi:hypothetical protein